MDRQFDDVLKAEERFRLVVESSPAGVLMVDVDGTLTLVNRKVESWFGYSRDELIGQPIELLLPEASRNRHVTQRKAYLANPQERKMGAERDLTGRRKDGSEFPVDVSLHPMKTEDGIMVMAHILDLTGQKRHELMQRLAYLGQLAASVAHEIRNPLGVISNSAYYLNEVGGQWEGELQQSLEDINRELGTANRIVNELLEFTRSSSARPCQISVEEQIRDALQRSQIPETVQVSFSGTTATAFSDPDQFRRILENLIRNAVQAMQEVGTLTIIVSEQNNQTRVEVSDTGPGIPEQIRSDVFQPLFTTKAKGFGLGLSVAKRYADDNGGRIELKSSDEPGCTFCLTVPKGAEKSSEVQRGGT